jgi:uncharacterized protein
MNSNSNGKSSRLGTAVITGASSGLGKVYADRLAQRGYDLLLVARRADRLRNLAEELRTKYDIEANFIVADLGNSTDLQRVSDTVSVDSRVSAMVNNAGTSLLAPSVEIPLAGLDAQLNVNARAVSHLSQAVLPGFIKRDAGTIINIGSVLSFSALPISTSYSATKAHVMLYTIGLQQELADTHVRVQLVLPASTATEIWDVAGIGVHALDQATVMTAEDCVDAALAGLDNGEAVTLPSIEDPELWADFDALRNKMFAASQTSKPASRYGITKKEVAAV